MDHMRKTGLMKIIFAVISIVFFIEAQRTAWADKNEGFSFVFDWSGIRLGLISLGILLGGLTIKPIRGFFGAIGGGFIGLVTAALVVNISPGESMNFIKTGAIPTAIFGIIVGILAQIHKTSRGE